MDENDLSHVPGKGGSFGGNETGVDVGVGNYDRDHYFIKKGMGDQRGKWQKELILDKGNEDIEVGKNHSGC